jgi:hypothetical protein
MTMTDETPSMDPRETAESYLADAYGDSAEDWRIEDLAGDVESGTVTATLGRYEESDEGETMVETAEGHGATVTAAIDAALGRTPDESPLPEI